MLSMPSSTVHPWMHQKKRRFQLLTSIRSKKETLFGPSFPENEVKKGLEGAKKALNFSA